MGGREGEGGGGGGAGGGGGEGGGGALFLILGRDLGELAGDEGWRGGENGQKM